VHQLLSFDPTAHIMSANEPKFMSLPVEIIYIIAEYMPYSDYVNFASANAFLRELLASRIFRSIRVTTRASDTESIFSLVHKYGNHVQEIKLVAEFNAPRYDIFTPREDRVPQTPTTAPEIILTLLANTEPLLPKLERICLHITPDEPHQWESWFWTQIYEVDDIESSEAQPLMEEIYRALCSNDKIKSLEIEEMLPLRTEVWGTKDFEQFLGRLETFNLSIWGGDNGAGWKTNTMQYYQQFCNDLGNLFFENLTNVVSVRIESDEGSALGDVSLHQVPFPLEPGSMRQCQHLELVNCYIGPAIQNFITKHAKVLKTLTLRDCDAEIYEEDGTSWEAFLDAISQEDLVLTALTIENRNVPLTQDEEFDRPDQEEVSNDIKQVRAILGDPSSDRKLFSYGYNDDKYGMHFKNEDSNVERFLRGGDQRAYDKLRNIVQSNASKSC
jgi:hypothetical protein